METENDTRTPLTSEVIEESIGDDTAMNYRTVGKWKYICNMANKITMEPCIFIYFLAMSMEGILISEVLLQKTCLVYFNYSMSTCVNISDHKKEQIIVERETNRLSMYIQMIKAFPTVIFVLFMGSWSDKHGRKILLMVPFVGSSLSAGIMWVNTTFWDLPPQYIMFTAIPSALSGGLTCLMMAIYSYISDISGLKSRSTRIAFLDTSLLLGPSCGLLLSNVTKAHLGFSGTFIITATLYASCVIYILFRIEETRGKYAKRNLQQELLPTSSTKLGDLFNCTNIKETFVTTFEKRENNGRAKIILLIMSICSMVFTFSGQASVFLYTKLKFNWNYEQFIYWFSSVIGFQFLGMMIVFPVLSYKFGVKDELLGLIGCVSAVADYLMSAFAVAGYQIYIAGAVGFLGAVPIVISRAITSKIVPRDVSGKVFSVLGAIEAVLPLAATPIYTITYNTMIEIFSGMFITITALLYTVSGVIFIILFWLSGKNTAGLVTEEEEEDNLISDQEDEIQE